MTKEFLKKQIIIEAIQFEIAHEEMNDDELKHYLFHHEFTREELMTINDAILEYHFNDTYYQFIAGEIIVDGQTSVWLTYCDHCEAWYLNDDVDNVNTRYGNETWCIECKDDDAFYCDICNEFFEKSYYDYRIINEETVCERCVANEYMYCNECDRYVLDRDYDFDEEMCIDCLNQNNRINSYHTHKDGKKKIEYFGVKSKKCAGKHRHIGFELEIDTLYDIAQQNEEKLVDKLSNLLGKHVYFEHDSSLENGFEIISQPHTIDAFNTIDWSQMLNLISEHGYRSHDTNTCGLHLHFSREFFGANNDKRGTSLAKLLLFYNYFYAKLVIISRRKFENAERWADAYHENIEQIKLIAKQSKYANRYKAVNLTNDDTIEFRLGRGTLNAKSFNAWVDLHVNFVRNSTRIKYDDVYNWDSWLKGCKDETLAYVKSRLEGENVSNLAA